MPDETNFYRADRTALPLVSSPDMLLVTVSLGRHRTPGVILAQTSGDLLIKFHHPRKGGHVSWWFAKDGAPTAVESAVYSYGAAEVE